MPVALAKAADALQALDPDLTREQAYVLACERNPSLYAEWGENQ